LKISNRKSSSNFDRIFSDINAIVPKIITVKYYNHVYRQRLFALTNCITSTVSESDWLTTHILRQVLNIRDGTSVLLFSDGSTLLRSELDSFILSLAINRVL